MYLFLEYISFLFYVIYKFYIFQVSTFFSATGGKNILKEFKSEKMKISKKMKKNTEKDAKIQFNENATFVFVRLQIVEKESWREEKRK